MWRMIAYIEMNGRDSRSSQGVPCNIAMVGLYGVGKTSLVRRYVESIFKHDYLPTIGVQISKKSVELHGRTVDFTLWDLAGEDDRQQLQDAYLSHAAAYIIVADMGRIVSLERAILLQDKIKTVLPEAPFVLALNKSDLAEREIGEAQLAQLDPLWTIIPTSARTGQGVEEIFTLLADRVMAHIGARVPDESDHDPANQLSDSSTRFQDKLERFLRPPRKLVIENAQPIEVQAGTRAITGCVSIIEARSSFLVPGHCVISCSCPARKGVRCTVAENETTGRIDFFIELPDNLSPGEELSCQFTVDGSGWVRSEPVSVVIV
jgi:small GTP-binding protein